MRRYILIEERRLNPDFVVWAIIFLFLGFNIALAQEAPVYRNYPVEETPRYAEGAPRTLIDAVLLTPAREWNERLHPRLRRQTSYEETSALYSPRRRVPQIGPFRQSAVPMAEVSSSYNTAER